MQASGSVDNRDIRLPCDGSLDRVEGDRCGIRAHSLPDYVGACPLSPYRKLVYGGRPEGVGGSEHDLLPLRAQHRGQLAYRGGLAYAVHAHDEHHIRLLREVERHGIVVYETGDLVPENADELVERHILVGCHPVLKAVYDLEGGVDTHIGFDQSLFHKVERLVVDPGPAHDRPFYPL